MSTGHADPSEPVGYDARISGGQVQVGSGNTQNNIGVDAGRLPPPQRVGEGTTIHNLPRPSAVFVGRDLSVLADQLDGDDAGVVVGQAAVHGLGGIGKSELVNHYARRYLSRYSLVWWITADGAANLQLGLAALTRRLHPVGTLADAQAWAIGWLQAHTGWLLVLDNVEDVNDVADLLGVVGGRGQVVVTTRRDLGAARWAMSGLTPFRLGVLSRRAAVDLLTGLTGHDDAEAAGRLAAELGDLPLALEQAAAYIAQHDRMGFDDYRQLLDDQFDRVASNAGHGGKAGRSIAAVWTVTMTAIARLNPLAAQVLDVLAWLAPEGLPDDVLAPLGGNPADIDDALAMLVSYSIISREAGLIGMHRLVQAVTRNTQVAADTAVSVRERAVDLLAAAIPDDPINNVQGWPRWNALLPHIDTLAGNVSADHELVDLLLIGDRAATYRQFQGQIDIAIVQFQAVLADLRRVLGEGHPYTLISRNNLALAYRVAGRTVEAIAELEAVLASLRRVLGEGHPSTLTARSNLASGYQDAGRTVEAVAEFEAVLADQRRVLGEDHPDTLISRSNLALAYRAAGRTVEAIAELEAVLADLRRVLGEGHPSTLTARSNLASGYQDAGRTAEAIAEFEALLGDRRRVLGEDHPDTPTTRSNLAGAYQVAGRTAEAVAGFEAVLGDRRRVLGEDHPDTLISRSNLAGAYQVAGRTAEAVAGFEAVLGDRRRV
ncbi:tetratricopeptide repeat protein, partial [Actinoplanes sp. NPDC051411]|uniref:tetratricopeptide repeat protein n=1 Tax=Actinoplanes sp. NPDC051411 TaxID=3155522 RepID=UPI003421C27A